MPDDQSTTEIEAVYRQQVAAHEKFVAEMRAMDYEWKNGTLDKWMERQIEQVRREAAIG